MTDLQEKRELAQEAKEILESKAFEAARAELRDRLISTLVSTSAPTNERKLEIVAKILQVIDEIAGQLRALDQRLQRRRPRPRAGARNQSSFGASARG